MVIQLSRFSSFAKYRGSPSIHSIHVPKAFTKGHNRSASIPREIGKLLEEPQPADEEDLPPATEPPTTPTIPVASAEKQVKESSEIMGEYIPKAAANPGSNLYRFLNIIRYGGRL